MQGRRTYGPGFWIYFGLFLATWLFSLVAGFGIGFLLIPIPTAMLLGLFFWRWKPAVAGLVAAALAGSVTYLLFAPLVRSSAYRGRYQPSYESCHGTLLDEIPLAQCDAAGGRALVLAVAAAMVAGAAIAAVTWGIQRMARHRTVLW